MAGRLITWLYRLLYLPSRHHELNHLYWQLSGRVNALDARLLEAFTTADNLRGQTATLSRDIEMLREELKKKAGLSAKETVKELAKIELSSESYLYFAFENSFRGSKEAIREIQKGYLEPIRKAKEDSKGGFLLDVGCGRGEFLKLLKENGIPARGVDGTKSMIDACGEQGVEAVFGDALDYLRSVPNDSLLGVTAFQVVEHLPTDYLTELVKAARAKTAPGGVIILETVNSNSVSSLRTFYLDLTHKNPIPPETLKFLVENAGYRDVSIRYSSPIPDNLKLQGPDDNTKKLNDLLFGPQDYAVIGRR